MPPRKAETYAFVNRTSKQPNFTGEQLSIVRSHTASIQQEQLRFKRTRKGIQPGSRAQHHLQRGLRFEGPGLNDDDEENHADGILKMLSVRAFSSRVPSDSLRRDPFGTLPAAATTEVYLALDHYIQVIATLYGAFVTPAGYDGNALLDVVVPVSLQNVYLFHTLVAHSRLMHLMAKDNSGTEDTAVIYHHSQALAALQLAVQDINDDTVPLAVIQLIQIEYRSGNAQAVALHTAGLQQIMLSRKSARPAPLLSKVVTMMISSGSTSLILKKGPCKTVSLATSGDYSITHTSTPTAESDPKSSIRAYMADSLPPSLRTPVSVLPLGFQDVILASLVSLDVIQLVCCVNDTLEQPGQAVAIWMQHMPQIWLSFSRKSSHPKLLDPWLCWAVLAHMFHHSPIPHRRGHVLQIQDLVQHVIQSLTSNAEVKGVLRIIEAESISLNAGNFAVRECAVWSLMSIAGAGERARRDPFLSIPAAMTSGNQMALDGLTIKLMEKVRWMMAFGKQHVASNANHEWRVLDKILMRFWCPDWLKGEWEAMYRRCSPTMYN